jgi:hypothetical protein
MSTSPSKSRARGERTAYLKLEKHRFLFLEGSAGAALAPVGAAVALAGATATLARTSAALAGSSNDGPVAGASTSATGTCATVFHNESNKIGFAFF